MATMFDDNMTSEMISDFKLWSRALGGESVMEGVKPDINKYISLGFCRDDFIQDMEYSWIGAYEGDYEDWEQAKIDEIKEWKIQAKHSDHFYHETERLREERNKERNKLVELRNTMELLKKENESLKELLKM